MEKVLCKECDFTDNFEPDEFGVNYYQAIGKCPYCNEMLVYENGIQVQETIEFKIKHYAQNKRIN